MGSSALAYCVPRSSEVMLYHMTSAAVSTNIVYSAMASTTLLVHAHMLTGAAFVCRLFKTMAVAPA